VLVRALIANVELDASARLGCRAAEHGVALASASSVALNAHERANFE
jgi:hypothetical protein